MACLTLCPVPFYLFTIHHNSDEKEKWKEYFSYLFFCLGWFLKCLSLVILALWEKRTRWTFFHYKVLQLCGKLPWSVSSSVKDQVLQNQRLYCQNQANLFTTESNSEMFQNISFNTGHLVGSAFLTLPEQHSFSDKQCVPATEYVGCQSSEHHFILRNVSKWLIILQ